MNCFNFCELTHPLLPPLFPPSSLPPTQPHFIQANALDCKDRDTRLQSFISRHGLGSVGPLPLTHEAAVRFTREAGEAVKQAQGKLAQLKVRVRLWCDENPITGCVQLSACAS